MRGVVAGKVFAGDFFQREKTVSLSAVINEGGFKAGFDAGNFTFIDIGFFLFVSWAFDIQIVQTLSVYKGDTQLLLLSCVDQHSFHRNLLIILTLVTKLRA